MISQTSEYALRAVVYLAASDNTPRTTQQIAQATHVPAGYLSKVMQSLGRADLVRAKRGLQGGFTLARPPADVSVLEIINAVDLLQRIRECPLGNPAHRNKLCPLHGKLDRALAEVERAFRNTKVEELLEEPGRRTARCPFPRVCEPVV